MRRERPAPPVTISGGPAPAVRQELPDTEQEPRAARPGRRTPLVLAALAVVAVARATWLAVDPAGLSGP